MDFVSIFKPRPDPFAPFRHNATIDRTFETNSPRKFSRIQADWCRVSFRWNIRSLARTSDEPAEPDFAKTKQQLITMSIVRKRLRFREENRLDRVRLVFVILPNRKWHMPHERNSSKPFDCSESRCYRHKWDRACHEKGEAKITNEMKTIFDLPNVQSQRMLNFIRSELISQSVSIVESKQL